MRNATDSPVRILILSTMLMPDLLAYPDSGKAGARDATGQRIFLSRPRPSLDYWDGES